MSVRVQTLVYERRLGSATRKAVAIKLADHADDAGRGVWPSVDRLAHACEVSRRSVQRVLAEFLAEGLLVLVRAGGKGPGSTSRYDIDLRALRALPMIEPEPEGDDALPDGLSAHAETDPETGDEPAEKGCHPVTLSENSVAEKGDTVSSKGDSVSLKGDTVSPKPSLTINNHHSLVRAGAHLAPGGAREGEDGEGNGDDGAEDPEAMGQAESDRLFRTILTAHPGWSGMPIGKWKQEWDRLEPSARRLAAERHGAWLAELRRQKRDHIPVPGTYFRERLWTGIEPIAEAVEPERFAPWGKRWMAWRLYLLSRLQPRPWQPTAFQQRMIDTGKAHLVDESRRQGEYPLVHALDIDALRGVKAMAGGAMAEGFDPAVAAGYARICQGSSQWDAWRDWHHARGWPWIDPPEHVRWVFVPADVPAAWRGDEVDGHKAGDDGMAEAAQ